MVDSDDAHFGPQRLGSAEELAKALSDYCQKLNEKPILACAVEGPPDYHRWIVFGIDRSLLKSMQDRPAAYDAWLTGEDRGKRVIDTWKASSKVDYILRGEPTTMVSTVSAIMETIWPHST